MKKIILIAMVVLVAFSCKKEDTKPKDEPKKEATKEPEQPTIEGFVLWTPLYFMVSDANGVDLLNPSNANSLKNIKTYKIINSVETLIYNINLHNPHGHTIHAPKPDATDAIEKILSKAWSIELLPYPEPIDWDSATILYDEGQKNGYVIETSTVRIQWNETNSDIIKSEFKHYTPVGGLFIHKVWVNGELKWERNSEGAVCFVGDKIIK